MKKKLTHNLGLKLAALFIAFALWLIVVNIDDPVITTTFSGIQVEIINESSLTDQGKVYEVLDNTDVVNVTVTGKRSVIDSLSEENIKAVADMEDLTLMNTLAISLSTNKNNQQWDNIRADHASVTLSIEDQKVQHMVLSIVVVGEPADGYVVGDINSTQNTVRVSGPESVMERVTTAACSVNVSGRTADVSTNADIRLYDANGERVEHPNLKMNISSVNISAAILATKAVDIVYNVSGTVAEGYAVSENIIADHTAVYVAGKQSALDQIRQINIPGSVLSVEGKTESFSEVLDLNDYLPDGIRLADDLDNLVTVNVEIFELTKKYFNIFLSSIDVKNAPEGYDLEVLLTDDMSEDPESREQVLSVYTTGWPQSYEGITAQSLEPYVDLSEVMRSQDLQEWASGIYPAQVHLTLPENMSAGDEYTVYVRLISQDEE